MRHLSILFIAAAALLASCTGNGDKSTRGSTADTGRLAKATDKPTAIATQNNPAIESTPVNNQIELTASDRMQYSDTLFKVKAGQQVSLKLTNIGKMPKNSMGHNFTLLKTGTDITKFASEGLKYRDQDYVPAAMKDSVIAHTPLVGPGESARISFVIKHKGYYDFICTFPGHYGSMRGKIVAE
ncbi:plastocyanin/azurin family copper-binding protein [Mucilaginibacter sp. SMC90]|uniref:plastocyanin/azurin family copper-binding protein n=1 Tax=Mucilaginibacter sp. SMC90 TaxID=2929803 RepID=UPI001FB1C10C|nr:plastocyanin/azurin family copper-binding protein [Mucilaginibacter sp. SMC90]UOE49792.1 plastocyanin/azurin family copper-binding protein [Mucilaginibacter sp. SMC90]